VNLIQDNAGNTAGEPAVASSPQSVSTGPKDIFRSALIGTMAIMGVGGAGYFSSWLITQNLTLRESVTGMLWIVAGLAGICGGLAVWLVGSCLTTRSNRMARLVDEIHKGHAPMEDLSKIKGPQKKLAAVIHEVFHYLRSQRVSVARLEEETRQRIANRTHALERKIGSLREQSFRDALTGLNNRRALDQMLPQIMEESRAKNSPLTLLMIDIDYFKELNDTLGHPQGDEFLRSLGQLIQSTIRQTDTAFRCGGDEFVILMPNCERQPALNTIHRLQSLTQALSLNFPLTNRPRLSVGACSMSEMEDPTPEKLIRKADEVLYAVKTAGKRDKHAVMAKL
jgi:diguanylate cyclase (GGDEF)-like protein